MTKKNVCGELISRTISTAVFFGGVYALFIRPWHKRWGAEDEEITHPLPGDELVPEPKFSATHAITIRATPAQVWPWIVQLGQGRGGFYSYDWIENAMGLEIHSADTILEEYQNLGVGDVIPMESGGDGIPVVSIDPQRSLVLGGRIDSQSEGFFEINDPDDYFESGWAFILEPAGEGSTRLIERFQLDFYPSIKNKVFYRALLEPGSFIMQRKMLLGIKERAERSAQAGRTEQ